MLWYARTLHYQKATQDQSTKTQGNSAPPSGKTSTPKLSTSSTPRASTTQKGTYVASASTQLPTNQKVYAKMGTTVEEDNKEVLADPNDTDKELRISSNLDPK
jgi:hypothetical protein